MGREWYFNWGSKSSSKKGGGTTNGGGGSGGDRGGDKKRSGTPQVATAAAAVAASGGCMNAVLHMFDFNHFNLCLHPNNDSYLQDEPIPLKGVEAPRNSLESITEDEKDNSLNIPMDIQIKTNRRDTRLKVEDTLSQSSCSPTSARTPTLVARLMGLDILPESTNTTPRSSSSAPPIRSTRTRGKRSNNNDVPGLRPDTPNSSSSSSSQRRSSKDVVVDQHRLSLQINKENSIVKEMESSRPSCSAINTKRREGRKYYEEENKSPGYYAKQIMKQVRETVSRRVGADITNTITQRELIRRDEHLLSTNPPTKPKKLRKEGSLSTSPKLIKSSENSNKISEKHSKSDIQEKVISITMDKHQQKPPLRNHNEKSEKPRSKMSPNKSYDSIRNKKDEQFVHPPTRVHSSSTDKKCKKTPLSSDLVHATVPSIIPLKKDSNSSSPQSPPKLLVKQDGASKTQVSKLINGISTAMNTTTRLSRNPSQRIDGKVQAEATHKPADPEKEVNSTSSTSTSIAESQYISRILKCTGIDRDTPISFTRWYSPSHPLDPTIFHTLEATHYLPTSNPDSSSSDINQSLLINRKLIFHLVDEILADILKPYIKLNPFHQYHHQKQEHINGFQLVKTLCTKLISFPSVDCKTLQDIDALVEKDMPRFGVSSNLVAFEEEGEAIVVEIEHDIVESLVQELALFCHAKIC